jgi:hypothetical protein
MELFSVKGKIKYIFEVYPYPRESNCFEGGKKNGYMPKGIDTTSVWQLLPRG